MKISGMILLNIIKNKEMKRKLEMKHLAPYSPYKLKCDTRRGVMEMFGLATYGAIFMDGYAQIELELDEINPILRPLSDYCGDVLGGRVMKLLGCNMDVVVDIWELHRGDMELKDTPYRTYECACRNHIDLFGLIEDGLAVNINDLK